MKWVLSLKKNADYSQRLYLFNCIFSTKFSELHIVGSYLLLAECSLNNAHTIFSTEPGMHLSVNDDC